MQRSRKSKETFFAYPDLNIRYVDASKTFISKLKGITGSGNKA